MIGAGTFINPLMKILVSVAVLAATYFFIIRPVLDTTENAFETVAPAFESIDGFQQASPETRRAARRAARVQETQAAASAARTKAASKLLGCIADASGDVAEINRCNQRFPVAP